MGKEQIIQFTLKHAMHEIPKLSSMLCVQKSVQQLVLKMSRNEQNLEYNIINGYPIFETLRKMHGVCKFDLTLEWDG